MRPRIAAWVDGELDGASAADVEEHLAGCVDCASVARDFRAIKTASTASFDLDGDDLWDAVEARIDAVDPASALLDELRLMRLEMESLRTEVAELRREMANRPPSAAVRVSPFSLPDVPERTLARYRLV